MANGSPGCVVAVGGSAGALEYFERFFRSLASDIDASYVVIQHMDPTQKSLLPDLLSHWTRLPVEIAKSGARLQARRVYVREPGTVLEIRDGLFLSRSDKGSARERYPIDCLMSSLASAYGSHAIGIVLSGTGTDGTNGLRLIQEAGGRTLVQEPAEAKFSGMPESAISAGTADRVMPIDSIAKELSRFIECAQSPVSERDHASELNLICEVLRKKTEHDFSSYKKSTVARRVERRLQANLLPSLAAYLELLERDPAEPRALLRDLLISVTQFFRDTDAFTALQKEVIPKLFEGVPPGGSVRVWVPACATGEEAYTIAMLLRSHQKERHPHIAIQIFATDIDRAALERARQGLYPNGIAEHVPAEYLARYFKKHEKGYQATQELREICLFSEHSLLKHPPFSKIDLLSCRNLFIYWEPELQDKILPVFHYALNPAGFLFLGPAENVVASNELFRTVDKKHRIFQRTGAVSRSHLYFPVFPVSGASARLPAPLDTIQQRSHGWGEREAGRAISSALLESYAPPAFVVTELGEIAYYSGKTGKYIEPPTGLPSNNVFDVVARPLRAELHALLHRCIKAKAEVFQHGVVFEKEGSVQKVDLIVRPMGELADELGLYLMVLRESAAPRSREEAVRDGVTVPGPDPLIQQLEEELRETREHLQSTVEEVKSSNEELLSMNEELQSANEELQTSKEELQSTNEELETVNAELGMKVEELDASNSDLLNFFHGTQVPILVLDRQFRIQKFTPAATKIFRLIPADLGRGILDITSLVEGSDLISDASRVLESLQPLERQLRTTDGNSIYIMRVTPYRTLSNVIAGVMVTFSDITELKKAQELKSTLAAIVESSSDAIVGRDLDGNVTSWNSGAERIFGFSAREAVGKPIMLIIPPDKQEEFKRLERIVLLGQAVSSVDTERVRKDGRRISVVKTMSPIHGDLNEIIGLSVIYRDVSDRKQAELESARLAAVVRSSNDAIISKDLNGIIQSWNEAATAVFGYTADEAVGRSIRILIPKERMHEEDMILSAINAGRRIEHYETERLRKDGTRLPISVSISPVKDGTGKVVAAAKIVRDITLQKQTEAALKEAVKARDEFLSIASHELKTPLTSLKMQTQMRKRSILQGKADAFSMEKLRRMIESDERQILRLTMLIDDMLDVARISSGRLQLNREVVELESVVKDVAERFQDQLAQAGSALEIDVRDPAPGTWDRFRLEQVVTNLLSNAIKYGAGKPILARVEADAQTAVLTVQDQGIGVAEADQQRIFGQFERAVSRNDVTGLGLGLYIVKEILEAHGAEIRVESSPGQGASFIVRLPRG